MILEPEEGFSEDQRPLCSDENPLSNLLCIDPEDDCEDVYMPNLIEEDSGFEYDISYV